jgi:DNA-binding transcriptional LysR family regulator
VHVLAAVRRRHPELSFEMPVESKVADVARREADIGVRTVRTSSKVVVERKLATIALAFFAAPSYVESRLPAARLRKDDLASVDFIVEDMRGSPMRQYLLKHGASRIALATTNETARIEAARLGLGVAVFADAQVRREQGLVRLDSDVILPPLDAYLVYHQDLRADPRVSAVVKALLAAARTL